MVPIPEQEPVQPQASRFALSKGTAAAPHPVPQTRKLYASGRRKYGVVIIIYAQPVKEKKKDAAGDAAS